MQIQKAENYILMIRSLTLIAISSLMISCVGIRQTEVVNISTPGDIVSKRLTDPCFDLGAVKTSDFFTPTVETEITNTSIITEVTSLPIPSEEILEGLAVGKYALNFEFYTFNDSGNCVFFRSNSLVNITGQSESVVDFDMNTGHSITQKFKTQDGNTVALYDLTNPTFTPATSTPEFSGLGIDPRILPHLNFQPGQTLWKISVNLPNQAMNKADLGFAHYDPKFVFFQVVDTPTDQQLLNMQSLFYKFSPENIKSLGEKFWILVYGS